MDFQIDEFDFGKTDKNHWLEGRCLHRVAEWRYGKGRLGLESQPRRRVQLPALPGRRGRPRRRDRGLLSGKISKIHTVESWVSPKEWPPYSFKHSEVLYSSNKEQRVNTVFLSGSSDLIFRKLRSSLHQKTAGCSMVGTRQKELRLRQTGQQKVPIPLALSGPWTPFQFVIRRTWVGSTLTASMDLSFHLAALVCMA